MNVLTQWLAEHEELLYKELLAKVYSDTAGDNSWSLKGYRVLDNGTLLGQFTQKLTKGDESIGVYFNFNKSATPQASIYLTAFFNKEYASTIEALLKDVGSTKFFTIQKYGQGTEAGTIEFGKGKKVNLRNIRAELKGNTRPRDIHFSIKRYRQEFIDEIHENLFKCILGETLYLKQVNTITYDVVSILNPSLLSIKELKKK